MIQYEDFKNAILKDSDVKAAYDDLSPEYDIIQAMIDTRNRQHITQKDLSEASGISLADSSGLENVTPDPSLSLQQSLAEGL